MVYLSSFVCLFVYLFHSFFLFIYFCLFICYCTYCTKAIIRIKKSYRLCTVALTSPFVRSSPFLLLLLLLFFSLVCLFSHLLWLKIYSSPLSFLFLSCLFIFLLIVCLFIYFLFVYLFICLFIHFSSCLVIM